MGGYSAGVPLMRTSRTRFVKALVEPEDFPIFERRPGDLPLMPAPTAARQPPPAGMRAAGLVRGRGWVGTPRRRSSGFLIGPVPAFHADLRCPTAKEPRRRGPARWCCLGERGGERRE